MFRRSAILLFIFLITCGYARPRLVVLSDYFKDPDDKQSLIRLLCYANEFEIEGLIATSLAFGDGSVHPERMIELLDEYAKVQPNFQRHAQPGSPYPSADSLKKLVHAGAPVIRKYAGRGKGFPVPYPEGARDSRSCDPAQTWIGLGKDTPASEHIIRVVDRDDPRPVWITVWGGAMDLAQALWKVRHERSPAEVRQFVEKIRLFQVSWQDTGSVWIWEQFPELFFILCFESHRGMYDAGPESMRDQTWVSQNLVQNHGPLGAAYPKANQPGIKEGDSPSFLHLLAPGLTNPERPDWGSWGGRYRKLSHDRNAYVDAFDPDPNKDDKHGKSYWSVGRWIEAANNDFAARIDASIRDYDDVNHNPVLILNGDRSHSVLPVRARPGESITLDASGSSDPDDNMLYFRWWNYPEAGSLPMPIEIEYPHLRLTQATVPKNAPGGTAHIILEVTDSGTPPLTSYRRLILEVDPN